MKKLAITAAAAFTAPLLLAGAASAKPADVDAVWGIDSSGDCVVTVTSDKDLSNIVYTIDGVDTKIEFQDGHLTWELDGAATDVWVKSGNNKSGDGPGYGEHFSGTCGSGTGGTA